MIGARPAGGAAGIGPFVLALATACAQAQVAPADTTASAPTTPTNAPAVAARQGPTRRSVEWSRTGGGGECVVLGPATLRLATPSSRAESADGGTFTVCFAADAAGRPEPLALDVPAGADVQLATASAGAATPTVLSTRDATGSGDADGASWRWPGTVAADQRLVLALGRVAMATLRARMRSDTERYEFAYDAKARTLQLVRVLGGPPLALATATLPEGLAAPRSLEFELHGFRLQAFVDGVRVLQILDGAIGSGEVGMAWRRDGAIGGDRGDTMLAVGAPSAPRPSAALVRDTANTATLHAASAAPPGPWAIVELALDRPHPLLLREASGCEPWLLQRPAAPVVLWATPKQELGAGTFAETPPLGPARAALRWPALPALVGQVALARVVFVAADGSAALDRSPAVSLRF